jgi:hypothetical protein
MTCRYEETIERIIDKTDLKFVLRTICEICLGKADHLRDNWQDDNLAKTWHKDAATLAKVASKIIN